MSIKHETRDQLPLLSAVHVHTAAAAMCYSTLALALLLLAHTTSSNRTTQQTRRTSVKCNCNWPGMHMPLSCVLCVY
jgi:hypothetical protein